MFSALLLSLALVQGTPQMSVLHSNTFPTNAALSTYYTPHAVNNAEVVANGALGGTYNVAVQAGASITQYVGDFTVGQRVSYDADPLVFTVGTTPLAPSGRLFRITGCFDYDSALTWSTVATYDGPFGLGINAGRSVPDATTYPAYSTIFGLFHGGYDDTQAFLRLYGNAGHGSPTLASDVLFSKAGPHKISVEVLMSTITGGDAHGGGSAASDGYIKVYLDGSVVISYTGHQVGHYINNQGPPIYWNTWANVSDPFTYVQFGVISHVKNIAIRDDGSDSGYSCAPDATIRVDKVTVPDGSAQSFDFAAGGGLTPTTFSLVDGGSQTFGVAVGSGYSVSETPLAGWSASISVNNGSSPDNIAVAAAETVVVTVTNTQLMPPDPGPPPCCGTTGPGGAPTSTGYSGSGPTGSTAPPPTTTPRVVPAGGAAPSYTACTGGGIPATASDPTNAQNLASAKIPLVHMTWRFPDGSVRRYGKRAFTSGNGNAVTARVLKWGPVRQVLADRHGSFQANQFTITLSDYDRALRTLLSASTTQYIDGKEVELLIETAANAALSVAPLVLSRGIITDYKFNRDLTIDLTVTDPLGYRYSSTSLDRPIPHRLVRLELFPNCPEQVAGRPGPIVYGDFSDDYTWSLDHSRIPVGIAPVIHVGKANTIPGVAVPESTWEAFAVAAHAIPGIQSVFGSNLDPDGEGSVRLDAATLAADFKIPGDTAASYYDITGSDGVTERWSLLFAKGLVADAHIAGRVPITINPCGIEDVGDGTGDVISDVALQFQHFLSYWVVGNYLTGSWGAVPTFTGGAAKVRTSSFSACSTIQHARLSGGYVGAAYLGEQKPAREWSKEFQVGGDMRLGVNNHGQLLAMTVNDTGSTTGLTTYTAQDHIVQDSFEIDPKVDDIFNIYTYEYGPEPATGRVSGVAQTIRHATSITNHGERVAQALINRVTRQKPTADDVAGRALLRSANAPTDVTFSLDLRGVALSLGGLVRVTHYQGIGATGWTSRVLMVTGITTHPDEDDFSTVIDAEDVNDLLDAGALALALDDGRIDLSRVA